MSPVSKKSLEGAKILIVDDEELLAWSIDTEMKAHDALTERCASLKTALQLVPRFNPDVVILDLRLPDGNGMELLKKWSLEKPDMPVILITAHGAIDSAIAAVRHGAFDYLQKPFEMKNLLVSVRRAAEISLLRRKVSAFQGYEKATEDSEIIGSHSSIKKLKKNLQRIAKSKSDTVIIYGESGTGKELAAHAVHNWSERSSQPFVEINCASIPENLLESELFGHEKGAFTDARDRKLGLFEIAKNGTIFLDEIGEMPLSIQAKFLRVLEQRKFRRLGGTKSFSFSARIVAATNRDLLEEVSAGRFREDLYYRLDILSVDLPPLRERLSDMRELVDFFMERFALDLGVSKPLIHDKAIEKLSAHHWPGNVRELKNVLQRAVVLNDDEELGPQHLLIKTLKRKSSFYNKATEEKSGHQFVLPHEGLSLEDVEQDLVKQALQRANYSRSKAAQLLGISRHTLRYRMEKYGIHV